MILKVKSTDVLNKVSMDRALRDLLGCGLKAAKDHTDEVLQKGEIEICCNSKHQADQLKRTLEIAGAAVELYESNGI